MATVSKWDSKGTELQTVDGLDSADSAHLYWRSFPTPSSILLSMEKLLLKPTLPFSVQRKRQGEKRGYE